MQLPFLVTSDLIDLSCFTNNPILHNQLCLNIPIKLPYNIPKFNGNPKEGPLMHIMTYHLWCLHNSLMDDITRLHIIYRTLTRSVVIWYIELKGTSYNRFNDLDMDFLMHFLLSTEYKTKIDILMYFYHDTSTHIFYYIH
jgi:hypothetical protein